MPEHCSKGPIFRALDERYKDKERRKESLEKLRDALIILKATEGMESLQQLQGSLKGLKRLHDTGGHRLATRELGQDVTFLQTLEDELRTLTPASAVAGTATLFVATATAAQTQTTTVADQPPVVADHPVAEIGKSHGVLVEDRAFEDGELEGHALELAEEYGVVSEGASGKRINDVAHVIKHWFTPREESESGWWSAQAGKVEQILCEGLIAALECSLSVEDGGRGPKGRDLPVDTVWICAGSDTGEGAIQVECHIHHNDKQVSLIILTPEEPHGQGNHQHAGHALAHEAPSTFDDDVQGLMGEDRGMFVVKSNTHGNVIVKPVEHRKKLATVPAVTI
jgi:hypothetical protein